MSVREARDFSPFSLSSFTRCVSEGWQRLILTLLFHTLRQWWRAETNSHHSHSPLLHTVSVREGRDFPPFSLSSFTLCQWGRAETSHHSHSRLSHAVSVREGRNISPFSPSSFTRCVSEGGQRLPTILTLLFHTLCQWGRAETNSHHSHPPLSHCVSEGGQRLPTILTLLFHTLCQWGRAETSHHSHPPLSHTVAVREEDPHLERQRGRHSPGKAGTLWQWGRHSPGKAGTPLQWGRKTLTWKGTDSTAVREEDTHLEGHRLYSSEGGRHSPEGQGLVPLPTLLHTLWRWGRKTLTWKGRDSTTVRKTLTWKGRDSMAVRKTFT